MFTKGELMTDSEARFVAAYEAYYPEVYAYCRRRMTSQAAEDATAETFLTAWRRIDELPIGREALLWLYRVAYRTIGHHWRSGSRRKRLETKMASLRPRSGTIPEDLIVQSDQARRVLDAAARLKPTDYEVLRLSVWEQLPHEDIASMLEISIEAVAQRLYRARKSLTKEINHVETMRTRSPEIQEGGGP